MSNVTDSITNTMMLPIKSMQQLSQTMRANGLCPVESMTKMLGGLGPGQLPMDPGAWLKSGQNMLGQLNNGSRQGLDPRAWLGLGQKMIEQISGSSREGFGQIAHGNLSPTVWVDLMRKLMAEMSAAMTCSCNQTSAPVGPDGSADVKSTGGWGQMPQQ